MAIIEPGAEYETDPDLQDEQVSKGQPMGQERTNLRVSLPKADHEAFLQYAADRDLTLPKAVAHLLATSKASAVEPVAGKPTLEQAAERLLEELDEQHVELLRECAMDRECRVVDFLLSAIKLAHERGETGYVAFEDDAPRYPGAQPTSLDVTCQWCGKSFTPTRRGQTFCPPREGEVPCSRQAMLAEVHKTQRPLAQSGVVTPTPR